MLYAFTLHPDRPSPRGAASEEICSLFAPAFVVVRQQGGDDPTGPSSAWYWLRRLDQGSGRGQKPSGLARPWQLRYN
jgi:hypothetical protein